MKCNLIAAGLMILILSLSPAIALAAPPEGVGKGLSQKIAALEAQVQALTQALAAETAAREAAVVALQIAIADEESARIAADTALEEQVAVLEDAAEFALAFEPFVTINTDTMNGLVGPHVVFEGANVHVRSGSGTTDDGGNLTGLGNLLVGYNEEGMGSEGPEVRTGSHNLVVGRRHTYSSFAGFVTGLDNAVTAHDASVSGGLSNVASGNRSSVSGGIANRASGNISSVSGGWDNEASGGSSWVGGGTQNVASGIGGSTSSVSGGFNNEASGNFSSVSGGANRTAPDLFNWAAGSLLEPN